MLLRSLYNYTSLLSQPLVKPLHSQVFSGSLEKLLTPTRVKLQLMFVHSMNWFCMPLSSKCMNITEKDQYRW